MNTQDRFAPYALTVPEILIPRERDLSRWAVIACDQFTQDRDYWARAAKAVGNSPSTLNLILPEVYLDDGDRAKRLEAIRASMRSYLGDASSSGIFADPVKGFAYIERKTAYGRTRRGLVAAIDLDAYDWRPDSTAPIRATEATIVDRIPPRMEIRRDAPIESPHIMLLVNDPGKTLIEGLGSRVSGRAPLYSTELMLDSGSIKGWTVDREDDLAYAERALAALAEAGTERSGPRAGTTFLFAVGDGNHSLATAKAVWEEFRAAHQAEAERGDIDLERHPARFALVELVNLYDEGLTFEPIHRVLFGVETSDLSSFLAKRLGGTVKTAESAAELEKLVAARGETRFGFVSAGELYYLDTPNPALAVSRLQPALDEYLAQKTDAKIDYIHGSDEVFRLGKEPGAVSVLLPPVEKDSFFATIASGGPLPRKSFSMGEASEKRFYLECRKLFS
jgi:uncharacterized protein (DUF1015 family)